MSSGENSNNKSPIILSLLHSLSRRSITTTIAPVFSPWTYKHPDEGRKVTELVEVCVDSRRLGDRTQQPRLEERGPAVDEAPPPSHVVLFGRSLLDRH